MFTWICPTCGREVPPSYDKCPDCAAKGITGEQAAEAAAQPPAAAPVSPVGIAPQAVPQYTPPPGPRGTSGLPMVLLAILFSLAVLGVCAGGYGLGRYFPRSSPPTLSPLVDPTSPKPTACTQ